MPNTVVLHLHAMIRSLLINIESLQKDPSKLTIPARHLYNILHDPRYEKLKTIFIKKSVDSLSDKSLPSLSQTPKSQHSSSAIVSSKEVSLDPTVDPETFARSGKSGNHFSFSEVGSVNVNPEILCFHKLKGHPGFSSSNQVNIHKIESFFLDVGVGTNYFVEPGTLAVRKICVTQGMIQKAKKNIVILSYKVGLIRFGVLKRILRLKL
jgi:hypothetical protein